MKTYSVLKSFEWPGRPRRPGTSFYEYPAGSTQAFSEWPPADREQIVAAHIKGGHIAEISSAAANPGIPDPALVVPAPARPPRLPASLRLR